MPRSRKASVPEPVNFAGSFLRNAQGQNVPLPAPLTLVPRRRPSPDEAAAASAQAAWQSYRTTHPVQGAYVPTATLLPHGTGRRRRVRPDPPSLSVLDETPPAPPPPVTTEQETVLRAALYAFGVGGRLVGQQTGPVLTTFAWRPTPGVKLSKLVNLQADLALALAVDAVRVRPLTGTSSVGIEVPHPQRTLIALASVLGQMAPDPPGSLLLPLGLSPTGTVVQTDLARLPHLLIAGATGSGKSVGLHSMLCALLLRHRPSELQLLLVDPKRLELLLYEGVPHLLADIVTAPEDVPDHLADLLEDIGERYALFSATHVQDVGQYNALPDRVALPRILVVIDELADLMATTKKTLTPPLQRLAQISRAAGVHILCATQRPSVNVVAGVLKANFPGRLAYRQASMVDSQVVLGSKGAEALLGKGDALFLSPEAPLQRVHGAFVSTEQIRRVVDAWSA